MVLGLDFSALLHNDLHLLLQRIGVKRIAEPLVGRLFLRLVLPDFWATLSAVCLLLAERESVFVVELDYAALEPRLDVYWLTKIVLITVVHLANNLNYKI